MVQLQKLLIDRFKDPITAFVVGVRKCAPCWYTIQTQVGKLPLTGQKALAELPQAVAVAENPYRSDTRCTRSGSFL